MTVIALGAPVLSSVKRLDVLVGLMPCVSGADTGTVIFSATLRMGSLSLLYCGASLGLLIPCPPLINSFNALAAGFGLV